LLDQTLAEMQLLQLPDGVEWEVLVVNNRCTDDTDEVIGRHSGRLPLRRLFEPRQGHCNARNCAIESARGDLIVWTDDDVLVQPRWLLEYVRAARAWPEAVYFGGTIRPHFETPPPLWITNNLQFLQGPLVIRDFGPEERPFDGREQPYGANMAFRTSVLREVQFDPRLGLKGDNSIRGDETAVFAALRARGEIGVWVPAAELSHVSPADRLTLKDLRAFFHGIGRTEVRADGVPSGKQFRGAPRWLYRRWLDVLTRAYLQRAGRHADWLRNDLTASRLRGMIHECRRRTAPQRAASPKPEPAGAAR
jgi:glycosyltransferase involved in cell wall biosynthesis